VHPDDVRVELCVDTRDPALLVAFWSALLGYRTDDDPATDAWVHLDPPHPGLPVVDLQRVPEEKAGKNRLHLDLYVVDPEPWIARAQELGATLGLLHDDEVDWFQVLADPEGNEFCICRERAGDDADPPG